MNRINLDFETYCDLDIKKVGAYKYAMHESCEVLLAGFSINGGKKHLWDATTGKPIPALLKRKLKDPKCLIFAFNATFERLILKYVLGIEIPLERFRCTQVHAYSLSFTGTLADVGSQIGIEKQKLEEGKELISFFCKPKKPSKKKPWTRNLPEHDPEKWEDFKRYCIRDVEAEEEIAEFCSDYPMPESEWDAWFLDQQINDRGLPLDMALVQAAIEIGEAEKNHVSKKIIEISKIEKATLPQIKEWLIKQRCKIPNLQGDTIEEWIPKLRKGSKVYRVLTLLQRITKSSYTKYAAMLRTQVNGRVYGTLQFMGAQRTARWAGRLIQPQNFIRPAKGSDAGLSIELILENEVGSDVMEHLATALRGAICAPRGEKFSIADLAGIEGRVLPWLCDFQEKLDKIKEGMDMYIVAASAIYGIPYEAIENPSSERFAGKVAELALGYQGGVNALNSMAKDNGLPPFEEEDAKKIVEGWREANKPIKEFWDDVEFAARRALQVEEQTWYGAGHLWFYKYGDFLCMQLPSGRCIYYHKAKIVRGKIMYMGWNSYKRKWEWIKTYGGKLVENATQATARDILVYGMKISERRGFKLVGSVHDEILSCQKPLKKYHSDKLIKCMTTNPYWASGLPLKAEGYTERRYRK